MLLDLVKSDVAEGATNTPRPLTQPSDSAEGGLAVDATQAAEEWRPALGYEGFYEVSSLGQVRSVDRPKMFRDGQMRRGIKGRELKYWLVRAYPSVHLMVGKHARKTYVHTLVCEAFHGLRPDPDWQVRHLNGNPLDNRAENLAWGTCFENHQDRIAHGTSSSKTACPRGHAYDKVRITKYGHTNRRCSICDRETMRRLTERRRVARLVGGGDAS